LSAEEYNVLNKIASITKMDCWFSLRTDDDGDYIFDLDKNMAIPFREGTKDLIDGCIDLNYAELSETEKYVLTNLLANLI